MARLGINTGSSPNDGTGDTLLDGAIKINDNFSEIYTQFGDGNTLTGIATNVIGGDNIDVTSPTGNVVISVSAGATLDASSITVGNGGLSVTGVSTLGVVTGAESINVTNLYSSFVYGDGSNMTGVARTDNIKSNSVFTEGLQVTGIATIGDVIINGSIVGDGASGAGLTYFGDGSNLSGVLKLDTGNSKLVVTGVTTSGGLVVSGTSILGIVTGASSVQAANVYATTLYGDGSNLTGIAKTEIISSDSLVVTGISTLGIITGASSIQVSDVYATTLYGDGSNLTGVANTESISAEELVVSGISTLSGLIVTGVSTLGIITESPSIQATNVYATTLYGDGSNLTGISVGVSTANVSSDSLVVSGISTLGIVTGGNSVQATNIYATNFYGDGSGLTGVTASGTGIVIKDGGTTVGTAGTIDFGTNLSVSTISAGVVTVTASSVAANFTADSLVVSGISTLGIVTGADSVQATDFYGKVHGNGGAITGINANNITSGTLPNNRFPSTLPAVDGSQLTGIGTFSGDYNDLSNKPTIPTNNNELSNGAGYITTSFTNTNQLTNGAGFITATGNGSELVDGRWTLGADGNSNYTFTGIGFTQTTNDPDLYLARGNVYEFVNGMGAHGFQIQDTQNGTVGNPYNNGVTNNGTTNGTVKIEVPFNAPDTLYYQCVSHVAMGGTIFIYPTLR